jgi:hypothetical protein
VEVGSPFNLRAPLGRPNRLPANGSRPAARSSAWTVRAVLCSVFDLSTGRRWVVARTRFNTVGLSIRDRLVVWGENHNKFARIVAARAG